MSEIATVENKNQLSVAVVGSILTPADFNTLDGLISSMGDQSKTLSDEEKKQAAAVIDEWNESVINRIKLNADQASDVLAFLAGNRVPDSIANNLIGLLNDTFGEIPEYVAYQEAYDAYELSAMEAPEKPIVTDDMTIAEIDDMNLTYERENLVFQRRRNQLFAKMRKAATDYVRTLNKIPDIAEAKLQLTAYRRKASCMAQQCQDKATRAKINITINNEDTRKLLHELLDFTKTV